MTKRVKSILAGILGGSIYTLLTIGYDLKANTELLVWRYLLLFLGFGFVLSMITWLSLKNQKNCN